MKRFIIPPVLLTFVALSLAACTGSAPGIGSTRPVEHDTIVLEIDNQHWLEATIFARYEGGPLQRLGLVEGQTRDTFVMRWQPQRLFFAIDLVGSGEFITDPPIVTTPSEVLELRLPSNLDRGAGGFRRVIR